jgi:glycosyltransferase involved in cell wall biosynthesis
MKIACYGFVDAGAGSVAGANHLLLRHLLQRGHTVDFFAKRNFVYPESLFDLDGFAYIGVARRGYQNLERWVSSPPLSNRTFRFLAGQLSYQAHLNVIRHKLLHRHVEEPYDIFLSLGTSPPFSVPAPNLPVVAWVQGPPMTEIEAIKRQKESIIDLCGRLTYAKLRAFYFWRDWSMKRANRLADAIICGSHWSRERIVETGVSADKVYALPYPFDLSFFESLPRKKITPPTFGWLGRIVPRKRIDLLLTAYTKVIREHPEARLNIVGHFNSFKGLKQLIETCDAPEGHISYRESILRSDVPHFLRSVTALVQPSENENFGSSVAEALAVGTPAILGPLNGTGEYAVDGCYHFDSYTPDALASAMVRCLRDQRKKPDLIARKARSTAERMFAPETVVTHLEEVLHRVKYSNASDRNFSFRPTQSKAAQ